MNLYPNHTGTILETNGRKTTRKEAAANAFAGNIEKHTDYTGRQW